MTLPFNNIFRPYIILYPFSMTLTATSSMKNLHRSIFYRAYTLLMFVGMLSFAATGLYKYMYIYNRPWKPFNRPMVSLIQTIYYIMIMTKTASVSLKNKVRKLLLAIQKLDRNIGYTPKDDKKIMWYNVVGAVYVLGHYILIFFVVSMRKDSNYIFFFPTIFFSVVWDCEIIILTCIAQMLCSRVDFFIKYLENIVKDGKKTNSVLDIYDVYFDLLHIVKKINKIWQPVLSIILTFEFYFATKSFATIFLINSLNFSSVTNSITTVAIYAASFRQVVIYIALGVMGQRVASRFDQVKLLAAAINDMDLGDELNYSTWQMATISAVCPGRIRAADSLPVDGQTPLSAMSAVVSAVIVTLQLGFELY